VQTPQTPGDWICSRFRGSKTLGLDANLLKLIAAVKSLQRNALYPLPAMAAFLLCLFFVLFLWFRSRSEMGKRVVVWSLWGSCAVGLAAGLLPMMVSQAMHYVGPVYGKETLIQFNMMGIVLTWIAVAAHLGYVGAAVWWDRRGGGGAGEMGMEMA
jgi:hypothetical protein|tara:strand:- start:25971 stop:26438 length:468 start_codon:yes stop_codon:yes gene_type:complete